MRVLSTGRGRVCEGEGWRGRVEEGTEGKDGSSSRAARTGERDEALLKPEVEWVKEHDRLRVGGEALMLLSDIARETGRERERTVTGAAAKGEDGR